MSLGRVFTGSGLFGPIVSGYDNSLAGQQLQDCRSALEVARDRLAAARSEVARLEKIVALLEKMPEVDELFELMAGRSRTGLEGK